MSLYVGQNGTPKKVSKLLVGVNGTAKEVKTGYTGNASSNSQLVYQSFNKETDFGKVNPVQLLTSGLITSDDVGRTVYLSNSTTSCQEWVVIGVNHDNTNGTVDLRSKYIALDGFYKTKKESDYDTIITYNTSGIRDIINGSFYNGFTDSIKNAMKTMEVKYYNQALNNNGIAISSDKVKLPSMTELGIDHWYNSYQSPTTVSFDTDEGNVYPYYGTTLDIIGGFNNKWLIKKPNAANNAQYMYLTRSACINRYGNMFNLAGIRTFKPGDDTYYVQSEPVIQGEFGYNSILFDAAPIIRFGK